MNTVAGSPVVLVRWPEDAENVERLRAEGVPRLLLVAPDAPPPVDDDPNQDWIRLPASDSDLWARVQGLELRADEGHAARPELPGDGRLAYRGRWVRVSPIGERLLGALVDRFGTVVSNADLLQAGWTGGEGSSGALRIHLTKLRRVLGGVGLELVLVPRRGYVLEASGHVHKHETSR